MKKITALFTALALLVGLCACKSTADRWQEQYDLGVRYLEDCNYEEAIIAFNAAIEIDPMQADAYLNMANAYIGMNDFDAAKEILEQGYELTGNQLLKDKLDEIESGSILDFWGNVRKRSGFDALGNLKWYQIFAFYGKQVVSMTTYDAFGNQTGYWDGFRYNDRGDLICSPSYSFEDGTTTGYDEFVEFDEAGNCIRTNTYSLDGIQHGYHISIYDEAGQNIRWEHYRQDGTLYQLDELVYDGDKLVEDYRYVVNNGQESLSGHTEYRYNEDGELITTILYDENGEIFYEETMGH